MDTRPHPTVYIIRKRDTKGDKIVAIARTIEAAHDYIMRANSFNLYTQPYIWLPNQIIDIA